MKNTKVIIIVIVAVVIVFVFFTLKPTADNKPVTVQAPTPVPVIPTASPSPYSAEIKAKIRSEFINTCHTKGRYSLAVCTCGADYLSANYSESDLAKMYLDYHATNVVPKALEVAADKCTE
jgi:hypothetical protein